MTDSLIPRDEAFSIDAATIIDSASPISAEVLTPETPEQPLVNRFAEMGLSPDLLAAIADLGYTAPTIVQEKTIPLALGIFDATNKPFAVARLVETVKRSNTDDGGVARPAYSLMTGFIGTASISEALSANGQHAEAYRLLTQKTYPSWLYSVANGATTIWERLNSYTVENGFGGNNSMNSFNHYSFGAVAGWMYNHSLGIQRDVNSPGFKHFYLSPIPDPTGVLTHAKGHISSMYGKISSGWSVKNGRVTYRFEVPANTSAQLTLQVKEGARITEGTRKWKANGDTFEQELASGKYVFVVE